MTIKVNVKYIDPESMQQILNHYNSLKLETDEPLELLDRAEGGFKIKITKMKNVLCDENEKIKQLRWDKQRLVSNYFIGFTEKEELLLFESLITVLKENVELQK